MTDVVVFTLLISHSSRCAAWTTSARAVVNFPNAHRDDSRASWTSTEQKQRASAMLTATTSSPPSDIADNALAAIGAGIGVATLTLLQHWLPLKSLTAGALQGLYVTTLCSSAIILNYGETPPSFVTVFLATFVPAAATVALMKLTRSSAITRPVSVAITMLWFKRAGCVFPPAAALANTFLDNPTCGTMGWAYVALPCTGNAILWAVAFLFSRLRSCVKRQRLLSGSDRG